MNPRTLVGAAGIAALLASSAVAAGAQTYPIYTPVPYNYNPYGNNPYGNNPYNNNQNRSNLNVNQVATRVQSAIMHLQRDDRDYGGHRVNAINDLQNAHNELLAAEQWAQSHGYGTPVVTNPIVRGGRGNGGQRQRRPEAASNNSLETVQKHVQRMISHLQQDSRDYGGHRVNAINALQAASNELASALQFQTTNPNR